MNFAASVFATVALAAALVSGRIVDQTTGQPLPNVHVSATGPQRASALTNARGAFTLRLRPGRYTLRVWSDDVPPQTYVEQIRGARTLKLRVCSTTLDYGCVPGGPGGG